MQNSVTWNPYNLKCSRLRNTVPVTMLWRGWWVTIGGRWLQTGQRTHLPNLNYALYGEARPASWLVDPTSVGGRQKARHIVVWVLSNQNLNVFSCINATAMQLQTIDAYIPWHAVMPMSKSALTVHQLPFFILTYLIGCCNDKWEEGRNMEVERKSGSNKFSLILKDQTIQPSICVSPLHFF